MTAFERRRLANMEANNKVIADITPLEIITPKKTVEPRTPRKPKHPTQRREPLKRGAKESAVLKLAQSQDENDLEDYSSDEMFTGPIPKRPKIGLSDQFESDDRFDLKQPYSSLVPTWPENGIGFGADAASSRELQ